MPLKRGEKQIIRILQICGIITSPIAVLCFSMRIWLNPCIPFSLGRHVLQECSYYLTENSIQPDLSLISKLWMILICSFCFISFINTCGGYMFSIVQLSYLQCCCFIQYIFIFKTQCMHLVTHATDFKNSEVLNLLQVYKQLQVLVRYYNKIQQDAFIVVFLVFSGYALVLSVFAILHNGYSLTTLQLILFACIGIDGFLAIIVICGAFARLHTKSTDTLKYLQTKFVCSYVTTKKSGFKGVKMTLASFTPLQVNFGSVNYIEKMTPMTMFDFCILQLMNLLLCT